MPRKLEDLSNARIGMLKVVEYLGNGKWLCRCDCGNETYVTTGNLKYHHTQSCGCLKHNPANLRHGLCRTRIYNIWSKMKSRCQNKNLKDYQYYGFRGITVCNEWIGKDGFKNFYSWAIQNGYSDELTLDRIDVNGNYQPSNCRWVTYEVQENNRRNNHLVSFNDESHTLSEWSRRLGVPVDRISMRLKNGWSVEKALLTPKMINKNTYAKEN